MTSETPESPEERAERRRQRQQRLRELGFSDEVNRPQPAPGEERTQLTFFFERRLRPSDHDNDQDEEAT